MNSYRSNEQTAQERGITVEQVERIHTNRGLDNEAISVIPEAKLKKILQRLEFPNFARLREAFRFRQEINENGTIPINSILNAVSQTDSLRSRSIQKSVIAGMPTGNQVSPGNLVPPTAGLNPLHTGWTSLGPGNIGGRTRSIVIDPANPSTMWIASVGGGVWRTDNGGTNWDPVDDLMANLAVTCLKMDPTNPQIIYAGTGEGFSNVDALRGAGIFLTRDGATWRQLPSTVTPDFQIVNRLAISSDGAILLAATQKGIFRSSDSNRLNWTKVFNEEIGDVNFHPSDPAKAVAGSLRNGQAYYTSDGGQTWKLATHSGTWSGRIELTYAAQDPSIVYASIDVNAGEIWRSTNGGKSYTRRNNLNAANNSPVNYLGEQGWYDNVIWAGDPTNSNLVIVGGIDLWKSLDGGNTLIDISTWWEKTSAHADHHCIVSHPKYNGSSNKTVFFANDGGIYKTSNILTVGNNPQLPRKNGWTELVNTYGVTQFYSGAGNTASGTIIGGAQDNGTLRFTPAGGSQQWTEMFGGDGGWCASDPTDPNYFYGEYVYLNIHRSIDGGKTSDYISGQFWNGSAWVWKPVPYRISDARNQNALFIAPFILDPNNANRILGGGMSLWRTNNAKAPNTNNTGPAWVAIKNDIGVPISAIAVAKGNSDLIWVGHANSQVVNGSGDIYKTINGTSNNPVWQKIDDNGSNPLPNRYCTRITVDPNNPNTVYVTFGGYSRNNIWKTTDGGLNWSSLGSLLPEVPIRALTIHPRKPKFLYLGSEVGVFASEDGGNNWSATNEGPTNCSVDDLFWMGEMLVCATHGRGMFQIDLSGV